MSVTSVEKDPEARTMTITAAYDVPAARVWQLWADPRQLERWWGPPTYPATVEDHDLSAGGNVRYFMTGPEGDKARGWWRIVAAEAPHRLEFEDGFADDAGDPNPHMPTMTIRVSIDDEPGGGSRMAVQTTFPSAEAMEQLLAMGMEEGMTEAASQIDAILAA
jgi:uncharacterized protein YndB with AHSA1/START domain